MTGSWIIASELEDTYPVYNLREHESERRRMDRYALKRPQSWVLRIDHSRLQSIYIEDLNSTGMQIVVKEHRDYKVGDHLQVELCLADKVLVNGRAEVKWIKHSLHSYGVIKLGLEFIDPRCKIARIWIDQNIASHVQKLRHRAPRLRALLKLKNLIKSFFNFNQ